MAWESKGEGQSLRVAGADTQELHASALDAARLARWSIWIRLKSVFLRDATIIARVTVHDNTDHAQVLRALDLEATEDATILDDSNLAFQVDIGFEQIIVVLVRPVVGIDKLCSHVATGRVAVEGRDAVVQAGGGIFFENVFGQRGFEGDVPGVGLLRLFQQSQAVIRWEVLIYLVCSNMGLDAP